MLGEAVHDLAQMPAGLAGTHHVDVELTKQRAMGRQCLAEALARLDRLEHIVEQRGQRGLAAHADLHPQGAIERQAGAQHHRELAGQVMHIGGIGTAIGAAPAPAWRWFRGRPDCRCRRSGAGGGAGFRQLQGCQALAAQLAQGGFTRRGLDPSVPGRTPGIGSAVGKLRHCSGPG